MPSKVTALLEYLDLLNYELAVTPEEAKKKTVLQNL